MSPRLLVLPLSGLVLALAAGCHHSEAPIPGEVFALTASGKLVSFDRDAPDNLRSRVAITGLGAGEQLVGIDFRPANGKLYALVTTGAGVGALYTIDPETGAASGRVQLSSNATTPITTCTPAVTAYATLSGTNFGVDFNPAADRLRVISDSGQDLRINADNGQVTVDCAINGSAGAAITAAAYSNSFPGTGSTVLYDIDPASDQLFTQNPPNNGTLANPKALGVDVGAVGGFDIDGLNNKGYAALTVGSATGLYTINVDPAATPPVATRVGDIGGGETIRGLALKPVAVPKIHALTTDNRLLSFAVGTPNSTTALAITGLAGGENLLGIDFRPAKGTLVGYSSTGKIYTINTSTGLATLLSTQAAAADDASTPYSATTTAASTQFGIDFNPVPDRLRIVTNNEVNLRVNVDSGATITDTNLTTDVTVSGVAYTNSFAGTTSTKLYYLDTGTDPDRLLTTDAPNDGVVTAVGGLGAGINATNDVGFDIAGGSNGLVLAAIRTAAGAGPADLYRIALATGVATPVSAEAGVSTIGGAAGPSIRGLAIELK